MELSGTINRSITLSGSMIARGLDGRGIVSIAKTGTSGLVDTYTITYTDATTSTFTVTNGANGQITATSFAEEFSSSKAYAAGDYVVYSGQLYQFTTAHAAGAWNASHATAVQIADQVSELKSALTTLSFDYSDKKYWSNGGYEGLPTPTFNNNSARLHLALVYLTKGSIISVELGESQQFVFGQWSYSNGVWSQIINAGSWNTVSGSIVVDRDSYWTVVVRKANNSSITVNELSTKVEVYENGIIQNVKDIELVTGASWFNYDNSQWVNGAFAGTSFPAFEYRTTRIRPKNLIHLYDGCYIKITPSGGQKYAIGQWIFSNGAWSQIRNDSTFTTTESILKITQECYTCVVVAKSNTSSDILPSELSVTVQTSKIIENYNSVSALNQKVNSKTLNFGALVESGHIICHRGLPYPENTYLAYKKCIEEGSKILEMDLAFTSDNVAVLLHDTTINRTGRNPDGTEISGTINISSITYEQALEYDFGIWKGSEYAGQKIPTLKDVLLLLKQKRCCAIIDLTGHTYTETQFGILHDILVGCGMVSLCALNGTSGQLVVYGNLYKDTPFNPTGSTNSISILQNAYAQLNNLTPLFIASGNYSNASDLTYTFFSKAHEMGIVCAIGFYETAQEIENIFNQGCDLAYSDTVRDDDLT